MYLRIFASLCLILISTVVSAAPTCSSEYLCQCTITSSPSTISFGEVTVPRDAPVGTLLNPIQYATVSVSCPSNDGKNYPAPHNSGWYIQYYPKLNIATPLKDVWATGYPGIGLKVIDINFGNKILSNLAVGGWTDFAPPISTGNAFSGTFQFSYQLVKTANTVAGGFLNISNVMNLVSHNIPYNKTSDPLVTIRVNNTKIVVQTCTVTKESFTVDLPNITANSLPNVGSTAGNKSFTIDLSCQAGSTVYITLTDNTTLGNRSSYLSLTRASTAKGVALQILKSQNIPVLYGPDSSLPGTVNQWSVGPSATTSQIPLIAQYIRTGNVTAGTVNAVATFTLSYQ